MFWQDFHPNYQGWTKNILRFRLHALKKTQSVGRKKILLYVKIFSNLDSFCAKMPHIFINDVKIPLKDIKFTSTELKCTSVLLVSGKFCGQTLQTNAKNRKK